MSLNFPARRSKDANSPHLQLRGLGMGAAASIMCRQEAEPRPSHPPKAVDLHLNSNSSLRLTPRYGLDLDTNWSPHPRTPTLSFM